MMSQTPDLYAIVQNGKAVRTIAQLPRSGRTKSGRVWSGTPNDKTLRESDIYPVVDEYPDHDPEMFSVGAPQLVVEKDRVRRTYELIPSPARLVVNEDTIVADGATSSTATLTDGSRADGEEVVFTVNGQEHTAKFKDHAAHLEVSSETPGRVRVNADGLGVVVKVDPVDADSDKRRTTARKGKGVVTAPPNESDERIIRISAAVRKGDFGELLVDDETGEFTTTPERMASVISDMAEAIRDLADAYFDLRAEIDRTGSEASK